MSIEANEQTNTEQIIAEIPGDGVIARAEDGPVITERTRRIVSHVLGAKVFSYYDVHYASWIDKHWVYETPGYLFSFIEDGEQMLVHEGGGRIAINSFPPKETNEQNLASLNGISSIQIFRSDNVGDCVSFFLQQGNGRTVLELYPNHWVMESVGPLHRRTDS